MPMVLEALPPEGAPSRSEPPSPDLLVFTVPGLAVTMPSALGPGRYLPIFFSEKQRDAALVWPLAFSQSPFHPEIKCIGLPGCCNGVMHLHAGMVHGKIYLPI